MNYQRVYNSIIQKARSENRVYGCGIYYERHHIVPKCVGGSGKTYQWKTHPNIILLTAREHFIAHQLLVMVYPTAGKLKSALWFMCNQKAAGRDYIVSSRLYEEAKLGHLAQIQGVPKSEEHRARLSESKKGVLRGPMSEEWRYNLKRSITGLQKTEAHRQSISKARSIPRYQYSLDGTFIKKWNSAKEAGIQLGIDPGDIARCCKGVKKTAGCFIWSSELKDINIKHHMHANASAVIQFTVEGIYVETYNSIRRASDATGVSQGSISQCAQGISKTGGGFIWKYEKESVSLLYKKIKL